MLQASVLDGLSFDPFSFPQDCIDRGRSNVGGRQVADGLW